MNTTIVEGYQLSPQQQRLWLLRQNFQDMPGRARCTVLLKGNIDITGLRTAFQSLIDSHEILHTIFHTIPGMNVPLQVIGDATTAWFDVINVPHLQGQCSQQDFESILPDIAQEICDQDINAPAIAKLYTLGKAIHVLFLDLPGLWLDHRGIECIVSELIRSYQPDALLEPEEAVQYAAVAQWLNELLISPEGIEGRAYWQDRRATERSRVPFARAAGACKRFHPRRLRTTIAPAVIEKIGTLTDGSEAALQSFLLACLNVLIWRMTAREDILIGTAFDGRTEMELRDVPGLLTRYIPILSHLASESTYAGVWKQMIGAVQEAEGWQDCFDWSAASPDGQDGTPDYFPLCFEYHNEYGEYKAGDITGTIIDSLVYNDLFDLRLSCMKTKRGLVADFYYNDEVLCHTDTKRLATYFMKLVEEAATDIEANIDALEILGEAERHVLLDDFARGKQDLFAYDCLPHAFEEQVKRTPHRTALVCQGRELTYAELNTQAHRLAYQLQQLGVKPEVMVAFCTERSLETIVSMLGIFKAGGVCVPLDPTYPKERLAFILKDCQATVVVTQEKLAQMFSEYTLEVVNLDTIEALKAETEKLIDEIEPEQLAYVIYTSGSTGFPKGVGVSHQAAFNHFVTMQREFQLSKDDRVLQFASLSFDVSLEQIFPALLCGATVVMRGPTSWSVEELNKAIVEQHLTVVNLTPVFWQQWTQEIQTMPELLHTTRLRLVIVGGEAMTLEGLRSWRGTPLATVRLLNAYGPTEAVITASVCDVCKWLDEESEIKTVPIGRPLANREIYILDRNGQPTARGIAGELSIGGELLARGYLNRPDLTAECFIPHPFSTRPGARLYKTGDLGRYLPDGAIEYLGRIDQQVKIRGFRIELEEIEAVLQKHPDVRTAIVIVREDDPGEKRLVAYVLLQQRYRAVAGLRTFLEEKLPAYMMPTSLVILDTLPLMPNGKVDRRALPIPDTARPELEETFVAPRTLIEETLAGIWCEVLALDQVGIHDNFFKLGGHSLVATQVIARVRTTFQIDVPVRILFQDPTIAKLAEKVTEAQDTSNSPAVPAITRRSRDSVTESCVQ